MQFTQEELKEIQAQFAQEWAEFWQRLEEGKQ